MTFFAFALFMIGLCLGSLLTTLYFGRVLDRKDKKHQESIKVWEEMCDDLLNDKMEAILELRKVRSQLRAEVVKLVPKGTVPPGPFDPKKYQN